jgi:hypothetical protein
MVSPPFRMFCLSSTYFANTHFFLQRTPPVRPQSAASASRASTRTLSMQIVLTQVKLIAQTQRDGEDPESVRRNAGDRGEDPL